MISKFLGPNNTLSIHYATWCKARCHVTVCIWADAYLTKPQGGQGQALQGEGVGEEERGGGGGGGRGGGRGGGGGG